MSISTSVRSSWMYRILSLCSLTSAAALFGGKMDCNALATAFPRMVYLPRTAQYENSTSSYFAAFENELQPSCVLLPKVTRDVVDIINYLQNTPADVKIAVRGGGHTPWAGAANIESGITVDMRQLTGVTVDANNVVSIAAGEVWANVYTVLEEKGLAVVGGRVSKVGVTGLTIGGMLPESL
jgi:FAD/FMN-containing dehydrogenase